MTTPESSLGYDNDRNFDGNGSTEPKTRPVNVVGRDTEADLGKSDAETSYIHQDAKAEVSSRWKEVQTEFVDDPRKSVAHAHQLVSDAVQRIVDTFTQERNQLERQWSEGEDVSTEELRVCLQRYREFFTRLVPLEGAKR